MTDRDISCVECKANLGTIRDARLRKDIVYTCGKCRNIINTLRMQINTLKAEAKLHSGGGSDDIFGDVFGDIFGGKK